MSSGVAEADSWALLNEPRIGVLSIERAGSAPHRSPIWYWVRERNVEFTIPRDSVKGRLLAAGAPASMTVHVDNWPYRYVTVQGAASVVRDRVAGDLHRVAERYLGGLLADAYVRTVTSDGVVARLEVERVTAVDFR